MKPAMRNLGIVVCSVAGASLGLLAAYAYYLHHVQPALTFEKTIIDLRGQTTFEGEVIRIQNSLINHTSKTLEIQGISASCGCLMIRQHDEPMSFPLRLGPKDCFPLDIKIYTKGRYDEQLVTARAAAIDERGEKYESLPVQVAFKVITQAFVIPDLSIVKVEASGKEAPTVHHKLMIAARGATYTELVIEPANRERFHFDVKKANGTVVYEGRSLNKCFEVDLRYSPPQYAESFSELLQFIPDGKSALATIARIDGIIEYPYRMEPERVIILKSEEDPETTATVVYKCRDISYRNLRVKSLPKGFRVVITNYDQNTKLLTISIKRDEVDWQRIEDNIVFGLDQTRILEVPVKKIRLD
jgi:hypothetical protein